MKYTWTNKAKVDIKRIKRFLKENGVPFDIAEAIVKQIRFAPKKLLQFPRIGRLIKTSGKKEIRRIMVRGYKIFYELRGDDIFILNVLHAKEDIEG